MGNRAKIIRDFKKEWQEYIGPQGGEGWQNTETGEVRYQPDKPDDESTSQQSDLDSLLHDFGHGSKVLNEIHQSIETTANRTEVDAQDISEELLNRLESRVEQHGEESIPPDERMVRLANGYIDSIEDEIEYEQWESEQEQEEEEEEGVADEEVEYEDWKEFEREDLQFLGYDDKVSGTRDGESFEGYIREIEDDLVRIETSDGEDRTFEPWHIEEYQQRKDDLSGMRSKLREHFEGIGEHNKSLKSYTNDNKYREFQDKLRDGSEKAKKSPLYEENPKMETTSAILASMDEGMSKTIKDIQRQSKMSLPEEMTVYRGIDVDADEFLDKAEEAMEDGDSIMDEGFQSTSINEEVAENFGNVSLNINTDHGVYVRAASEHANEDEIVLPSGTRYDVEDVDRDTNTVTVTAVPNSGFNFDRVNVDELRELMNEKNMSYEEAIEYVR